MSISIKNSRLQTIAELLKKRGTLTSEDIRKATGCVDASALIRDLRINGLSISSRRVAIYTLNNPQ